MEDKIKIGEFARTKEGYIAKCEDFYEDYYYFDETVERRYEESFESIYIDDINKKIVKHSFNIMDLIEVGDYVNGMLVIEVIRVEKYFNCPPHDIVICNRDEKCILAPLKIYEKDIKSIVTKEQFESVEYEVK